MADVWKGDGVNVSAMDGGIGTLMEWMEMASVIQPAEFLPTIGGTSAECDTGSVLQPMQPDAALMRP